VKSLIKKKIPFEIEVLTREDQINEYLLTTLRTQWGCDLELLQKEFTYNVVGEHLAYIKKLVDHNLALFSNGVLTLTKSGKLLADKIASDLFC
jgi:oxygen-independent coproporphyrinogen III oxidase